MSTRPRLFTDTNTVLQGLVDAVIDDTLQEGANYASEQGMSVNKMPKYLEVTERRMEKNGIIDLKPYFANSPKRKINKEGKWYMYIPISIKTRDMSRRAYDELRAQSTPQIAGSQTKMYTQFLYDRRKESPAVPSLNYKPRSHNVTAIDKKWGSGTRREYIAFRTVNQDSPPNSWIINRGKANEDELSKTLLANMERLMKWKLNNL